MPWQQAPLTLWAHSLQLSAAISRLQNPAPGRTSDVEKSRLHDTSWSMHPSGHALILCRTHAWALGHQCREGNSNPQAQESLQGSHENFFLKSIAASRPPISTLPRGTWRSEHTCLASGLCTLKQEKKHSTCHKPSRRARQLTQPNLIFLVLDTGTLQASQGTSKTLTRQSEPPSATHSAAWHKHSWSQAARQGLRLVTRH